MNYFVGREVFASRSLQVKIFRQLKTFVCGKFIEWRLWIFFCQLKVLQVEYSSAKKFLSTDKWKFYEWKYSSAESFRGVEVSKFCWLKSLSRAELKSLLSSETYKPPAEKSFHRKKFVPDTKLKRLSPNKFCAEKSLVHGKVKSLIGETLVAREKVATDKVLRQEIFTELQNIWKLRLAKVYRGKVCDESKFEKFVSHGKFAATKSFRTLCGWKFEHLFFAKSLESEKFCDELKLNVSARSKIWKCLFLINI